MKEQVREKLSQIVGPEHVSHDPDKLSAYFRGAVPEVPLTAVTPKKADEVVALGASIQGAVLKGDRDDVLLLDVTPLSLGIETLGGVMTKLIEKNTTIPAKKSEVFSTAADNQTSVSIHVLQGEREMAADNKTLGRFELVGIPPAPRGMPQIEVTFDIDANGIVEVSAKDQASGKVQSIRITSSSGLSKEEIDNLVRDAALHAEADKSKKALIDARNAADALIYHTEKTVQEFGEKVDRATRNQIENTVNDLKKSMESEDTAEIKRLTEVLTHASHILTQSIYNQPPGGAQGPSHAASAVEDDVVDADYEEVA